MTSGTWTRTHEGRTVVRRQPGQSSRIERRKPCPRCSRGRSPPSARCSLRGSMPSCSSPRKICSAISPAPPAIGCLLKDRPADGDHPKREGILAALINRDGPGIDPDPRSTIDITVAKALSRAMEQRGHPAVAAIPPGRRLHAGRPDRRRAGVSGPACQACRFRTNPSFAASASTPLLRPRPKSTARNFNVRRLVNFRSSRR